MNTYRTIEKGIRTRFSNTEYVTYYTRVDKKLNDVDATITQIDAADFALFEAQLDIMAQITQRNDVQDLTILLSEADRARDEAFFYLQGSINAALYCGDTTKKAAAKTLQPIINKYKDITTVKYDDENALIIGLCKDFSVAPYNQALNDLDLSEAMCDLENKNGEFESLNSQRDKKQETIKLPPSKDVRAIIDPLFDKFCTLIEASYLLSTDAETTDTLGTLITDLSAIADHSTTSHNQSQAQKKKTPTPEPEPTPTPEPTPEPPAAQ